ncbi:YgaP family membrane protein [Variovorax sp. PBL-H6]|uniref:YgaP family membrane protein n=1 Tax=Variovorax sp. PBL-H6 TaxID=434009 RepID=UPI002F9653C0
MLGTAPAGTVELYQAFLHAESNHCKTAPKLDLAQWHHTRQKAPSGIHCCKDLIMIRNIGTVDRVIRVAAGAALVVLALASVIGAWGYLGVIPLLTGALGNCPAYKLFGVSTCPSNT